MALGDYTKTTYVNGTTPAINATNLNNTENKVDELDKAFPIGAMLPFAGSSTPTGWFLCNGQEVNRTTYAALFTAIGTTWGIGNGTTTFNVPDMRESAPIGAGTFSAVTGTTHGAITAHDARSLGVFADDQSQGHIHTPLLYTSNAGASGAVWHFDSATSSKAQESIGSTGTPITDSTNGTPRTGTVTRGKTIGVNYIIKY